MEPNKRGSTLAIVLGLATLVFWGWLSIYGSERSAARLTAKAETLGATALAGAGHSWARIEVTPEGVARLTGIAPSEAARAGALAAAEAALGPMKGVPGLFFRFDNAATLGIPPAMTADIGARPGDRAGNGAGLAGAGALPPSSSRASDCQRAIRQGLGGRRIDFATNGAAIRPSDRDALNAAAAAIGQCAGDLTITVAGHTDPRGPARYNKTLSQRRAQAVVAYLVSQGVAPERLTAVGFGEERLVDRGRTARAYQRNRRIEFSVSDQ